MKILFGQFGKKSYCTSRFEYTGFENNHNLFALKCDRKFNLPSWHNLTSAENIF